MKIIVVSNMFPDEKHPSYGIFVKRFCDQLETIGIDYDKCVMYKADSTLEKALRYALFYTQTFLKLLFGSYDLVYVHYASYSSIPVLLAAKLRKIKIYTNVHGSDVIPENSSQEAMQKYTKAILRISSRVIVPSEYFSDVVIEKYMLDPNIIRIYPSAGIDKRVFHEISSEEKEALLRKYGLDSSLPTFGFVSRINARKGWDILIRAISICKIQANWLIVGSGPEEEKLDSLIKETGLTEVVHRVSLLPQEELSSVYGMIDYLIFPTKGESLGLVAIESMACGTPVIASDFAAPKYYIVDEYNGYKFEMGNVNQLVDKLNKASAIIGTNKYDDLKANALKTASSYYTENILPQLKSVFEIP